MPSCVIIVENLPVPFDRRVWQEARALREAGWVVSIICPTSHRFPARRETLDGINIFRHSLPIEARGIWGFFLEYTVALFHEFRLLLLVHRHYGFDIIQACNPPDLIFLVAVPWKLFGKRFVFDHHDICPELLEAKFGAKRMLKALLMAAERLTFKAADLVISANESFRQLAIGRGGKRPEDVVAVYSIPDKRSFGKTHSASLSCAREMVHNGRRVVIGYVGIIGDQDGVDNVVRMAKHLSEEVDREDFVCVIVGDGPALSSVKSLAAELGVSEYVTFTGYLTGQDFLVALSSFDIGIIPDPINCYNDKISMNKVFEYAAMGIPIVGFNLTESRRLLKDAAIFAERGDAIGLAAEVARLIRDPLLRSRLGEKAKELADRDFIWEVEAAKYVAALTRLFERARAD
jgi:glycosyltransferase involved in cell wall biosynthesis